MFTDIVKKPLSQQDYLLHQTFSEGHKKKPKQNCMDWSNCQWVYESGSPGFHKHCLGCCKASHSSQDENCTLREGHSPYNLGSFFFSFGLLRDYSLSHMLSHCSWIGTNTPKRPEFLQYSLSISTTSSLLYWSFWDIPECFPVQWNFISTPLPSAVPHVTAWSSDAGWKASLEQLGISPLSQSSWVVSHPLLSQVWIRDPLRQEHGNTWKERGFIDPDGLILSRDVNEL